ncbi:MAG: alpha/beta fold hydrolase [Bdellovibrionota bacterium]
MKSRPTFSIARTLLLASAVVVSAHFSAIEAWASPTTTGVTLSGGREAVAEMDFSDPKSPWIVFVPGSGCARFNLQDSFVVRSLRAKRHFNVLVINKTGVAADGSCRTKEFELSSLRDQRVEDTLTIMDNLLRQDAKVVVIGESEGGYLTPEIAKRDSRVLAMVWISGGTRSWIEEEISFVAQSKQAKLRRFMDEEVRPNPTFDLKYKGWTYAQLVSFDNDKTMRALRSLSVPALLLNGTRDGQTWVAATSMDLRELINGEGKSNLEFHFLKDADHGLKCAKHATSCEQQKLDGEIIRAVESFADKF